MDPQNDSVDNCRPKLKLIDEDTNVKEPKDVMLFGSIEELHEYYRNFAKQKGFGVIQKKKKNDENGDVHYITLACARQGSRQSSSSNSFCKPSKTIRTGCKATLNAKLVGTKWYVTNVNIGHNHDLSPGKARYFRCHKNLDPCTKRKLEIDDRVGIRMNKIYNSLAIEAGGYENLPFGEKDCRNYIAKSRRLRLGTGGATALRGYFDRMRKVNDDFYYDMDVDDECRLKNVFWADARSRASYEDFGDVVTFDTTYLTNKYEMPFAPFVGVNHHGQSILLRAALISSEDTSAFVWLFDAWLKCMKGRAPRAIITDQDRAMKSIINKGGRVLECYNLEDNAWLCSLYNERTFWVPAYLKGVFWAGMTTTQRSYVHSSTSLKEFVDEYDNALRRRFPIEKQFQKIYTHAKFKEVQKEITETCQRSLVDELDTSEDLLPFVNDVQHDQAIGIQNSVVTQMSYQANENQMHLDFYTGTLDSILGTFLY
ncbi:protein FAR-RED IMPAIRED RESPONSE 1-like [Alnus glutinosa]|uniref:protein FAR-RED IMPAIRED RESPONSE 1-like n=1 Tax=Alnus glutinosa TaxID=3517 RepID=UPI002D787D96|nr:protein FAR-RED IMPAIRED RESPONSE 1-like [Alnus glutinosa]